MMTLVPIMLTLLANPNLKPQMTPKGLTLRVVTPGNKNYH